MINLIKGVLPLLLVVLLSVFSYTQKVIIDKKNDEISRLAGNNKALTNEVSIRKDSEGRLINTTRELTLRLEEVHLISERVHTLASQMGLLNKKLDNISITEQVVDTVFIKDFDNKGKLLTDTTINLIADTPHLHIDVILKANEGMLNKTGVNFKINNDFIFTRSERRELVQPKKQQFVPKVWQYMFGKRHTIYEIEVMNTNPYIKNVGTTTVKIAK